MNRRKAKDVVPAATVCGAVYLDGGQVKDAKGVFERIWRSCDATCRKAGGRMPEAVFVEDNADSLERAAHIALSKGLVLVGRTMLCDNNDPSKGFLAELVVWERTGPLDGVSKIAVTYETAAKRWVFFFGLGRRHNQIADLANKLGMGEARALRQRVIEEIDEGVAAGRMSIIAHWAVGFLPSQLP